MALIDQATAVRLGEPQIPQRDDSTVGRRVALIQGTVDVIADLSWIISQQHPVSKGCGGHLHHGFVPVPPRLCGARVDLRPLCLLDASLPRSNCPAAINESWLAISEHMSRQ